MQRGFTKLFNTIVTSTIWQEDDKTRIVWITMLAIADADGIVSASIPGLASVANVSIDSARVAVAKLEGPDPDSRTEDFEGRRIEKIEGGWHILNYTKYRRMLSEDERREYKAKWIADKRRQVSTVDKSRKKSSRSTQAEAEADKEKKGSANGSRPTSDHDPSCNCGLCYARKKWKHEAKPQSVEDWLIKLEQNPTYRGINVRQLHGRMVTWCEVRGLKPTLRRLVTWLNKEDKPMPKHAARVDYKRNYPPAPTEPEVSDEQRARLLKIAAEEKEKLRKSLTPAQVTS